MKAQHVELMGTPKAQKDLVFGIDTIQTRIQSLSDEQCQTCDPELWVSFFFDGTNNSRDIDLNTLSHTNIVRLFRAHIANNPSRNIYGEYLSGVGTLFRDDITQEVIDKGGDLGAGFAIGGEKRLEWAMKRLKKRVADTLAKGPRNTIKKIHIALFGFSRGAALARAFAQRIAKAVEVAKGGTCHWNQSGAMCPIEIYFMGLFDTVASVGTPTSMRKKTKAVAAAGAILSPVLSPISSIGVFFTSTADGHGAWGKDLRIPSANLVKGCLHLVAAHELRESFPLDLVAEQMSGGRAHTFPHCKEFIYPGAHSDIGGGYCPGAQGRGDAAMDSSKLSQIPLHHMFRAAWAAGVPLRNPMVPAKGGSGGKASNRKDATRPSPTNPVSGLEWGLDQINDFKLDPGVVDLFNAYLDAMVPLIPGCKSTLQGWIEAHMDLYYRWRATIVDEEPPQDLSQESEDNKRYFRKGTPKLNKEFKQDTRHAWNHYPALKSPYQRLLAKAWQVYRLQHPNASEAVEDDKACQPVTIYEPGLGKIQVPVKSPIHVEAKVPTPEVCRFFIQLVHDSAAAFWNKVPKTSIEMQTDDTRLCNPRVFYIGGDDRAEIAKTQSVTTESEPVPA